MSGFRPFHALTLLIAAAAIAGPVWLLSKPASAPQAAATPEPAWSPPPFVDPKPTTWTVIERLEKLATRACRCARGKAGAGVSACWAEFDRVSAPLTPAQEDYTCKGDEHGLCFAVNGLQDYHCMKINRTGNGACTAEEAARKGVNSCAP